MISSALQQLDLRFDQVLVVLLVRHHDLRSALERTTVSVPLSRAVFLGSSASDRGSIDGPADTKTPRKTLIAKSAGPGP